MKTSDIALILLRLMAVYYLLVAIDVFASSISVVQMGGDSIYLSQIMIMGILSVVLWFIAPFDAMLMVKKIDKPIISESFNTKYQVQTTVFTVIGLILIITSIAPLVFQLAYSNTEEIGYLDEAQKAMMSASNNGMLSQYIFKIIAGIFLVLFSESLWKFLAKLREKLLK
jgi:magnesium-transporting ATPase (P-type)